MAYTITLTDGTVFATVNDGTINNTSSVTLVGKNYSGYGEFLDENFIHLLENSANSTSPSSPLTGQLWYDKTNNLLKVYSGSQWKVISAATAQASAPTGNVTGDLWFDTVNQQLKVWTGAAFLVVGPAYSASQGTSGAIPETITDSVGATKYITSLYVNNNRVGVVYDGASFVPQVSLQSTFPTIFPGITLTTSNSAIFAGTANNASYLNSLTSSQFMRSDTNTSTTGTLSVLNNTGLNVGVGNAVNLSQSSNDALVASRISGGNLALQANVGGTTYTSARILGGNGTFAIANAATVGTTLSATGNITGGNLRTAGQVSAAGNIMGTNVQANGTGTLSGGNVSVTGTVQAVTLSATNASLTGTVSATGNITAGAGSFFIGNGSQLTGLNAAISVSKIENGTSFANIGVTNGDLAVTIGGTSNVAVFNSSGVVFTGVSTPNIVHTGTSAVGNIGSVANPFQTTHTNSVVSGTVTATGNVTGGNVRTAGQVSATGNVTGGNLITVGSVIVADVTATGVVSATGNVTGGNLRTTGQVSAAGNVTGGNVLTAGQVSATGDIFGADISATGNILSDGNKRTAASTSGSVTNVTFTIPTNSKRITVLFNQVKLDTADNMIIQLGNLVAFVSSGYESTSTQLAGSATFLYNTTSTSGFVIYANTGEVSGAVTLYNITGNTWVASGVLGDSNATERTITAAGRLNLGDVCARVRVQRTGAGVFTQGSVNVFFD